MNKDLTEKDIEEISKQIEKFESDCLSQDIKPKRLYIMNNSGVDLEVAKRLLKAKSIVATKSDIYGTEYSIDYE